MIKSERLTGTLILIIGCCFLVMTASSQTIKVNIKVNSTIGIQQVKPLEVIPESWVQVTEKAFYGVPRSINTVATFAINGKENMDVLIRLDAPDMLMNKEKQVLPFNMKIAWQNNMAGDVYNLEWYNNKTNVFKLRKGLNQEGDQKATNDGLQAYLYLKGTTEVPFTYGSPFEGTVHLTIEY